MRTSDFYYELPEALIAQYPPTERRDSRLLVVSGEMQRHDLSISDLPAQLTKGDVLVLNNTRVMAARLNGRKRTGGKVEVLIEKILSETRARAFIRASRIKVGATLDISGHRLTIVARKDNLYIVESTGVSWLSLMDECGHVPLPPYIQRDDAEADVDRYQTVYSEKAGAVAAPTAGLHFDCDLLAEIEAKGITIVYLTLHVGAGTFQPVKCEHLEDHVIHTEYAELSEESVATIRDCQRSGGRVVAVGTTVVRTLEFAARNGTLEAFAGDTNLFIYPGYQFKVVDVMLTNFHLPESTLLMLVSAFIGQQNIKKTYQHAIDRDYRFFSYGDAMLLQRPSEGVFR